MHMILLITTFIISLVSYLHVINCKLIVFFFIILFYFLLRFKSNCTFGPWTVDIYGACHVYMLTQFSRNKEPRSKQ